MATTSGVTSQAALESLYEVTLSGVASQAVVETFFSPNSTAFTQAAVVESMYGATTSGLAVQAGTEVFYEAAPSGLVSQAGVEALYTAVPSGLTAQAAIEVMYGTAPAILVHLDLGDALTDQDGNLLVDQNGEVLQGPWLTWAIAQAGAITGSASVDIPSANAGTGAEVFSGAGSVAFESTSAGSGNAGVQADLSASWAIASAERRGGGYAPEVRRLPRYFHEVGADLSSTWAIRQPVTADLAASSRIAQASGADLRTSWAIEPFDPFSVNRRILAAEMDEDAANVLLSYEKRAS